MNGKTITVDPITDKEVAIMTEQQVAAMTDKEVTTILDNPISWKNAFPASLPTPPTPFIEKTVLKNLQGNILKGHGRNFTTNIFFNFRGTQAKSKDLLKELGKKYITDAFKQFEQTEAYKKNKGGSEPFYHIALSFAGYQALGLENVAPNGDFFRGGMKGENSRDVIKDDTNDWEKEFRDNDIHALLIVAHDDEHTKDTLTKQMIATLENFVCDIKKEQKGEVLKNKFDEGIEHFGYVDGRSQPLLLTEEIDQESMFNWKAEFPLKTALVKDTGVREEQKLSFGSFLIFRKLEQNVRAFKTREQEIATQLGLTGEDRELAGAMLVGRFEDGTPVTLSKTAFEKELVFNDFDYSNDTAGMRCPIHAHIRKTNPRGSAAPRLTLEQERGTLFVRRGIPYGNKGRIHPNDLPEVEVNNMTDFKNTIQPLLPTKDVGLLFMGYNSNIERQFKIMQSNWANENDFPTANTGIDPVIASKDLTPSKNSQKLPNEWDKGAGTTSCPFSGFVAMKGGEYFFSPSMTFLRSHH